MADIAIEEILARHLVALGEAQHLAAERGQAAVEGIEVVDQELDLGRVELHAFDLRGEVLAQLLVAGFVLGRWTARRHCRHRDPAATAASC